MLAASRSSMNPEDILAHTEGHSRIRESYLSYVAPCVPCSSVKYSVKSNALHAPPSHKLHNRASQTISTTPFYKLFHKMWFNSSTEAKQIPTLLETNRSLSLDGKGTAFYLWSCSHTAEVPRIICQTLSNINNNNPVPLLKRFPTE
jgi:hypothetical protein